MIRFLRWMLGLCNHQYVIYDEVDVPYRGDEGSFVAIDMAFQGVIKYRAIRRRCIKPNCCKIKVTKVTP